MSVERAMTHMEMWFGAGALLMTLLVGLVLYPAMKKALSEDPEGRSQERKQ
jgi:hypothetical protein